MKLTLQDVTQKKNEFEKAGITLPSYDIEAVHKKTLERMPSGWTLRTMFSNFQFTRSSEE